MKKYTVVLFVAFLLVSCGNTDAPNDVPASPDAPSPALRHDGMAGINDVRAYLDATSRLYQERFADTAAIAALLTKGLAEYPDSVPLLQSRADLFCSRGMLPECRADTRRLLELNPKLTEARMMLCLLDEFEGMDKDLCEQCYVEVVELYAAQPQVLSAEKEISYTFNYVFALLMAGSPDTEKEEVVFLEMAASDPQAFIYKDFLNNFSRERVLRGIFGKE